MKHLPIMLKSLMKKAFCTTLLLLAIVTFWPMNKVTAQVSIGVDVHIPLWAPHYEHVREVQYYYLPDIEVYYDVWSDQYVYFDNGVWIYSRALPPMYADYDLNRGHVVVLERGIHKPWVRHRSYVSYYPKHYFHGKSRNYYVEGPREHRRNHTVVAPRRSPSDNVPSRSRHEAPRAAPSHQQGGRGHHEKGGKGNGGHRR